MKLWRKVTLPAPIVEDEMNNSVYNFNIIIKDQEAEITESGGRSFFILKQKSGIMPAYCEIALSYDVCPHLLPMRFIRREKELFAYYDYGEYYQLNNILKQWQIERRNVAIESIKVITSIIRCALSIENYLFISEGYRLHEDTVFVNPITGEVRLAYIPEEDEYAKINFVEKLAGLIERMADLSGDDQWSVYAAEIVGKVLSGGDSISTIERKLHSKGRQIWQKGWPEREELRSEGL